MQCVVKAESTHGHYEEKKQVLTGVQQNDRGAETADPGLIPGIDLRPADILTVDVGGGAVALDIGICSPDAQNAGDDCTQTMLDRKKNYYAPYANSLDRQNIRYQPLIWSSFGRPHPQTTTYLRTLSKTIARRRGCLGAGAVYAGLHKAISIEIWRRASKQVMSCWPAMNEWDFG